MYTGLKVKKRSGNTEDLNINKIHAMVEHACEDITNVSISQIEMNANLQFYDGIESRDIQEILIRSANDLISLDHPNYQFVAARLLLSKIVKEIYGDFRYIPLHEQVKKGVDRGVYDSNLVKWYDESEWVELNNYIDHKRDMNFTYAGIQQIVDKYLVQDRSTGELFETPQYMYMLIAATLFHKYESSERLNYVKKYYDAISKFKINIPTPVMAGVRTPIKQFASCVLVDIDDTLDSIFNSDSAIGYYVARRAGIGINSGRIRGINSKIRGGEVQHTGVIPFLKKFESTVRCCTQNGVRGGSATVHFPIWHKEIEDIIVLKNNKGTEDNRVRKLDYSIQISKLFYERLISDQDITLFSPHDVPDLYDVWGNNELFDELYVKYENDPSIPQKKISSMSLFGDLVKERAETGRIYIMNIDHTNTHSSFKDQVTMSNLCQEITLPTTPIQDLYDENGEIALCILSAINIGSLRNLDELEVLCDLAVRSLDEIIEYQDYPLIAAEKSTKARRSLGIGYIGLAHYLAKNGVKYSDVEALKLVHELSEAFQYNLLKASNNLAKEKGKCDKFDRTKYSDGLLPIDHYKKDIDKLYKPVYNYDWETLRKDIKEYGLRNSTLSAQMPSESSSVVSNETNGIEPPRAYLSIKKSKKGTLKQIVPGYTYLKNNYELLWDMPSNEGYIKIVALMQKFFDQSISGNWSYNPQNFEDNEVPMSVMLNDLLTTYKYGWKTSYYQNTFDGKEDDNDKQYDTVTTSEESSYTEEYEDVDVQCEACVI